MNEPNSIYYGINTGFGSLCDVKISDKDLTILQENLLKSHACGTGEEVPTDIVKIILLLKIQNISLGYSGVRELVVNKLCDFYNHNVLPVLYQQGSLGASGDLAPLAHLSLPLLGKGEVHNHSKKQDTSIALEELQWNPINLSAKEGLALINGTQFTTGYGVWSLLQAKHWLKICDITAALSLDAFDCRIGPFHDSIHVNRHHKGQIRTARIIRKILEDSEIMQQEKHYVQDPYSFRCIPQVHGASADVIRYVEGVLTNEINAVTDNPLIFPDEDLIISGGNFHAQPIALALDYLGIALAELASISERRTYKLISGERSLPSFLVAEPGINSGMMITQYTAASIVSQNKQLATPASVDSITSSNGQEDHVSMGANAATKLYKIVENLKTVISIEFMNAAQAISFRRPAKTSSILEQILDTYRQDIPTLNEDRILFYDIEKTKQFLANLSIDFS